MKEKGFPAENVLGVHSITMQASPVCPTCQKCAKKVKCSAFIYQTQDAVLSQCILIDPPKTNETDLNDLNDFIFHSPGAKKKNVRRHFGTTGRIASTEGSATTAGRRACVTRGKGTKPTTLLAAGDGFVWTVPIVRTTAPLWTRVTI